MSQRQLGDQPRDLGGLGAIGLEKFPARRHIEEEVRHFEGRAFGRAHLPGRHRAAAGNSDFGTPRLAPRPRPQQQVRHRRDARQRLPAEPQRHDRSQVVEPADLAGRVSLERQLRLCRGHPLAIVLDPYETFPTQLDTHANACRAGIERILDQLLDDRCRSLNHLAGGDLVREFAREPGNPGCSCHSDAGGLGATS